MADGESISKLVIDVEVNDKKALLALSALQQRIKNFNSSNGGKAVNDMASNMEKMTKNTAQARREAGQFIEQVKKNNKNLMPTDLYGKSMKQYQKELSTAQDKIKTIMSTSAPDKQLKGLERYTVQAQMARNAIAELQKEQQKSSSNSLANFTKIEPNNGRPLADGEFERIRAEMQGKGISRSSYFSDKTEDEMALFQKETKAAEELQQKIERISRKVKQLSSYAPSKAGASEKLSKEYLDLEKNIDKASQKLQNLYTKEALMKNAKPGTERYQKLQIDIKNAKSELDGLVSKMRELQLSGKDITSIPKPTQFDTKIDYTPTKLKGGQSYSKDYIRLTKEIQRAENALEKLKFKQEMMKNSDPGTERYKTLQYNIAKATRNAEELAKRMRDLQASGKDVNKVSIGKQFQDATKQADKMGSAVKKVVSALGKEVTKLPNKLMKSLLRLGTMFRAMLLRRFIMQVFKSMKEAVDQLAVYSNSIGSDFNKNISTLVSDFKYLGRVIVTAFEPLINFAVPILDFLIQKVVTAINAINQFFNAIMGNSTWTKATYNAENYADSLDKASGNAKKLKQQLQGFDELNNISSNQGGGGSGSGGGSANAGDMFSTQPVSEAAKGMAERFKEAWDKADFTDIGKDISDKITKALNSLPWDGIKETANKIAKSLATFLNGFINPDLFGAIGSTLAEALNTVFGAANTFAKAFDWTNLGKSIASTISNFFKTFDFVGAGMALSNMAIGLMQAVTNAVSGVDWHEVGVKLVNFLSAIDWESIIVNAATLVGSLISGMTQLLFGVFGELAKNASETFKTHALAIIAKIVEVMCGEDAGKKVMEVGTSIVDGISEGISENLKTSANWIKENFQIIVDKVKEFFGIHSPSTVFAEIGGYLIDGLKKGMSDTVSAIGTWIKTNVIDKITAPFDSIKEITMNIKGNVEDSFNKAKEKFEAIKDSDAIKKLKGKVEDSFSGLKEKWDSLKDRFAILTGQGKQEKSFTDTKTAFDSVKDNTVTKTVKAVADKTWTDIKAAWDKVYTSDAIKTLKGKAEKTWNDVKSAWDSVKSGEAKKTLKGKVEKSFKNMKSAWDDWKPKKKVTELAGKGIDTVKKGLKAVKDVWDSFTGKAKKIEVLFHDSFSGKIKSSWNNLARSIDSFIDKIPVVGTKIASMPKFPGYANGGFPRTADIFYANENGVPELVGTMGGKTAVASGTEITGISDAIYSTSSQQIAMQQRQIDLLTQIVAKEFGISERDIFNSVRNSASDYTRRTGIPAF